jgi:hypothetical protein
MLDGCPAVFVPILQTRGTKFCQEREAAVEPADYVFGAERRLVSVKF